MIGPWATAERSEKSRSWARRHIGEKGDDAVQSYYNGVRILSGSGFQASIVAVVSMMFPKEEFHLDQQKEFLPFHFTTDLRYFTEPEFQREIPIQMLEQRYANENAIWDAAACGNTEAALKACQQMARFTYGGRFFGSLYQTKIMLTVMNTLLRKAIERSNIHPYYIDEISSRYALMIENMVDEESWPLVQTMVKEYCAYSDNEEQAAAVKEVDRAFARMETVTPKAVNPDEQSIIVVCKGFGDEGDDTVCIEVGDLRNWKEKHTKKSEPISDEMLTFMSTDEIENAVMNQDLPTKYAFELSAWDEILSWKLAPSSIYIYGLEFCLSRVLWEMTFFGVDESGVELEKEKLDTRFEEAQRFFDENKEPQIGFSIEDIAKKLLGDDYTEDWYPEEEQERDRRNMVISSYIASTTAALFWWVDG